MTLTLERPETVNRFLRFATQRGMTADELLEELLDDLEATQQEQSDDYKLTPEDIAALRRGAADSDAGRVSDGHAHIAQMKEFIQQRKQIWEAA